MVREDLGALACDSLEVVDEIEIMLIGESVGEFVKEDPEGPRLEGVLQIHVPLDVDL